MSKRSTVARLAAALVLLIGTSCLRAGGQQAGTPNGGVPCDHACLVKLVDQYLAAMVKHDAAGLALAANVKFTENTATLPIGDGLWVGASEAPTTFKIYAADPTSHQVAFYGLMKEFDKPILLALRLKVEDGKITEIEHVVVREVRDSALPNLTTPRPGLVETIPPAERSPREKMVRIANSYFEAIEHSDGSLAPFADDCARRENGLQTTTNKTPQAGPVGGPNGPMAIVSTRGCRANIDTHILSYITNIRPRRLIVVDEERGIVFGFPMFNHRGAVRTVKIVGVPGVDSMPMTGATSTLQAAEIFGIRNGQIHEIEAIGYMLPCGSKTGWE
jgi:hypothetical protein